MTNYLMQRTLAALVTLVLLAPPALAQNVPPKEVDPRLAGQAIAVLQAIGNLREAEMKALAQDMAAKLTQREQEWAEYAKPLYAEPPHPDPK